MIGLLLVVVGGILFLVVLLQPLLFFPVVFSLIGGLLLIWLFVLSLIMGGGSLGSLSLFVVHLFGLLLGCLLLIRLEVLSLLRSEGFGKFYDERLQFMSRRDALLLDESLQLDDVSMAWSVWSRAAEAALADAYQFSGGPLPCRGLVLGRGAALFRWVQLGGPYVRRARANVADALDAADVSLYRDRSVAPLLDMRRRFKAVMDLLDAMIRFGVSLSRSVELTIQWDRILAIGPVYPISPDDLSVDRGQWCLFWFGF